MPCIIDTNILVDSLREKPEAIAYLESKKGWTYSVVNTMELMAGARNKKEIAELEKYLGAYQEIPLSESIGLKAREIMRKYSKADGLDPMDALIAATAICEDLTLSTQNDKHYRNIDGLKLEVVRFQVRPAATEE